MNSSANVRTYDPRLNVVQTPNGYIDLLSGLYIDPNTGKYISPSPSQTNMAKVGNAGASECYSGEYIESISGDGKIIKTSDNRVWEVDDYDTYDSMHWQSGDDIVICSDESIINTDSNSEKAQVTLLD
ncbi:hypothetical protein [Yersinia pseudotuberculosis]|uniref:hypothetical protein n=1 Tax=Yersinia pseudotuberculosis TaxID=633 RepID=UPI00069A1B32|nr:hypothetical protein [Yersinia pseudotuberculosis]